MGNYVRACRTLARAGATLPSILLFPLRRRTKRPRNQVLLRGGTSPVAPVDEPLLELIKEIRVDRCYAADEPDPAPGVVIVDIGAHVCVLTAWAATQHQGLRVSLWNHHRGCARPCART